jgi:hypothetical protein
MHFHWRNLVVIPVDPQFVLATNPVALSPQYSFIAPAAPEWHKGYSSAFTQIGQPFIIPNFLDYTSTALPSTAHIVSVANQILTCSSGQIENCMFDQVTFQIQSAALRARYIEEPLIIPTNILQYAKFSGQPAGNGDDTSFSATLSQCLENCDSVFLLVPNNNFQETCFYQPYLKSVRLMLGEFGIHPSRYVSTWNDPRFLAMCLDSLNLERSDISSINKDVARSLGFNRPLLIAGTAGAITKGEELDAYGDNSSFFIGISLSQVGFQSGTVSSPNTNIPFIF